MNEREMKNLAGYFAESELDYKVLDVKACKRFPTCVKVFMERDTNLEVTSDVAIMYFGNEKTMYDSTDVSYSWQEFVLDKAIGKAKLERCETYLKTTLADLEAFEIEGEKETNLEGDACDADYTGNAEDLEELVKHICNLLNAKFDIVKLRVDGYKSAREAEQIICADHNRYLKVLKEKLDLFLAAEVRRTINEKGEEVFEFTESQNEFYETFKNGIYDLDFSLRQKNYNLDMIEKTIVAEED